MQKSYHLVLYFKYRANKTFKFLELELNYKLICTFLWKQFHYKLKNFCFKAVNIIHLLSFMLKYIYWKEKKCLVNEKIFTKMFQAICLHMLSQLYYRHDGSHYILHYVSTDQLQKTFSLPQLFYWSFYKYESLQNLIICQLLQYAPLCLIALISTLL